MRFATRAIHDGIEPDSATGAIMTPIYQTSTFVQKGVGIHKGYEYSRAKNPTRSVLEANLAALESGTYGACFGSGLAALDCVLKMLSPGDEVISTNDLYGGSYRVFNTMFAKYGIKFHYTAMDNAEKVRALVTENTRLVWVETPSNPTMNIIDIRAIADAIKGSNAMLAVDNTFSTPFIQRPLELGADLVLHSATKYLGGHSDVVLGALITSDEGIANEMYRIQNSSGAICGPQDAFLVLRGIKTLHLRMERHCANGMHMAEFLTEHSAVDKVYYPGLSTHRNHEVAASQMNGYTGMLSFSLRTDTVEAAHEVLARFRLISLAESLGGVESLAGHPVSMTHTSIPADMRRETGIVDSLIRLSVGIEDIQDLLEDMDQALS